jgi:hypothetical protein
MFEDFAIEESVGGGLVIDYRVKKDLVDVTEDLGVASSDVDTVSVFLRISREELPMDLGIGKLLRLKFWEWDLY